MSSRQFVLHLFFLGILSLRYHDTNQIWISVRYDGWNIFPRVITLDLIWSDKLMSCLAFYYSFLFSKVKHSSMRKSLDLFYKLFLMDPLCIQIRSLLKDHVNAIPKNVCVTPISDKNIWSTMQKFSYQLSKHRCMANVMKFSLPSSKGFSI